MPASDPFRLTPLLLAKLKLDNLRQSQHVIRNGTTTTVEEDDSKIEIEWGSESAKHEYNDLKSVSIYIQLKLTTFFH